MAFSANGCGDWINGTLAQTLSTNCFTPMRSSLSFCILGSVLAIVGTGVACQRATVELPQAPPPPTVATLRYLALGDSYTIGQGVDPAQRFPVQLRDSLRLRGLELRPLEVIARTGWSTGDLLAALASQRPDTVQWDLVTLLIGVNNQYRRLGLEGYQRELEQLLQLAIAYAGGRKERVIVLSIPDYSVTPFGKRLAVAKIRAEINDYNAAKRQLVEQLGLTFLDITDLSRAAATRPQWIAADDLHPSGLMYQEWVKRLRPLVQAALAR